MYRNALQAACEYCCLFPSWSQLRISSLWMPLAMELDEYCWNFQDQHLKTPQQQTKHTFTSQSKHVTRNFISVGERSLLSECIVLRYRDKRPNIFRPSTRLPVRLSWHPSSAKALKSVRTSSVTDLVPLRWRRWSRILVLVGFLSSERSLPFKCITCTINFCPIWTGLLGWWKIVWLRISQSELWEVG